MSYPYAPPQPPPPPKNNTLRTVLLVVGGVLVLCCVGSAIALFLAFRGVVAENGPAGQAAETFIGNLRTEDYDGAYRMLCERTREEHTVETLRNGTQARGRIIGSEIVGVHVRNTNGRLTATVNARIQYDAGFIDQHSFPMVKEDGAWKVCGAPY